ncbi:MAG: hypothetical protein K8J08_00180 [Thermoanaerobaculia bacterium]|nr:hypothetical protein [Thermoanaerobaculia bacterium]
MFRITCLALLALALPSSVSAQDPPPPASDEGLAAMQEIAFLIGEWHGSGWMRRGPAEPQPFESTETIEGRLDGRVLLVEGLHRSKETGEVVHSALAVISYDPKKGEYRFRSYLADGRSGDYSAQLENGNFVWNMDVPNGKIRYTIAVKDDGWNEKGEYSADGASWNHFFQMDLERVQR